jgi:NAD-dependent SIR2 family protein deacetylase
MNVTCRDCGRLGEEDPDDPAPALCPTCYEKRLQRITPRFLKMVERLAQNSPPGDLDITPAIVWLAEALEAIGGETREHARKHANELGHLAVIEANQQNN